eukprot:CAMPEP_0177655266 /NCGR_PEP_ID=MMETSP0447-20121125/14853_1 /TAXON_ID=0 /ORGANISM="Stygamoeba regulata, Strain BSH-02190019" /LENGTH=1247 /DNA_ID=CAMNT_0019159129 /DNA_START=206 /DNA_END=3950 /DNA_ORIENTATION=+
MDHRRRGQMALPKAAPPPPPASVRTPSPSRSPSPSSENPPTTSTSTSSSTASQSPHAPSPTRMLARTPALKVVSANPEDRRVRRRSSSISSGLVATTAEQPAASFFPLSSFIGMNSVASSAQATLTVSVAYRGTTYTMDLSDSAISVQKMVKRFAAKITKREESLLSHQPASSSQKSSDRGRSPNQRRPKESSAEKGKRAFSPLAGASRCLTPPPSRPVAKTPLEVLMQAQAKTHPHLSIPIFYQQCVNHLYRTAGKTQLIFRQAAPKLEVEAVVNKVDSGEEIVWEEIKDPHVVSSLLKHYLTKLPTPLIDYEIQDSFLAVAQLADETALIDQLKKLFMLLSLPALDMLASLCFLWNFILTNKTATKMTANALGVCCAPWIFWRQKQGTQVLKMNPQSSSSEKLLEVKKVGAAVRLLIEHADVIFADSLRRHLKKISKHNSVQVATAKLSYTAVMLTLVEPSLAVVKLMDDVAEPAIAQDLALDLLHLFSAQHHTSSGSKVPRTDQSDQKEQSSGLDLFLLMQLIRKEMATCDNPSTYFRSNTITSHLLTQYCKKIGQNYLLECLRRPLEAFLERPEINFEVNPRKVLEGENLQANQQNVLRLVNDLFRSLFRSEGSVPLEFCHLAALLQREVVKTHPAQRHSVVGSFLVLRFLASAVVSPEGWNVVPQVPMSKRRGLVLASKVLQNLSNGTEFREDFMSFLKPLLDETTPRIQQFFDSIAARGNPNAGSFDLGARQPVINDYQALAHVVSFLNESMMDLDTEVRSRNDLSLATTLKELQTCVSECPTDVSAITYWPPIFWKLLLPAHTSYSQCLGVSGGHSQVWTVLSGGTLLRWSTADCVLRAQCTLGLRNVSWILNPSVAHGKYLWLGSAEGVEIWDREKETRVKRMDSSSTGGASCAILCDNVVLIVEKGGFATYDPNTFARQRKIELRLQPSRLLWQAQDHGPASNHTNSLLANNLWVGGEDGSVIKLSPDLFGVRGEAKEAHNAMVCGLATCADRLLSVDTSGILKLWDLTLNSILTLEAFAGRKMYCVVGTAMWFFLSVDKNVLALNPQTLQVEFELPSYHTHSVVDLQVLPETSCALTSSTMWSLDEGGAISVWLLPLPSMTSSASSSATSTSATAASTSATAASTSAAAAVPMADRSTKPRSKMIPVKFSERWVMMIPYPPIEDKLETVSDLHRVVRERLRGPEVRKSLESLPAAIAVENVDQLELLLEDADGCELDPSDRIKDVWSVGDQLHARFV